MKTSRRITLMTLILGLLLFLGILFHSFVYDNIIKPIGLVFWLIWRIWQSLDQGICWGVLISSALLVVAIRLFRHLFQGFFAYDQARPSDPNFTLEHIDHWRSLIQLTYEMDKPNSLKYYLIKMVTALYASKQTEAARFEITNALKLRQIPLPEDIHAFLFPPDPSNSRQSINQTFQAILQVPRKWMRRLTGRDVAEYRQSIGRVLAFLETSMEIVYDDQHNHTLQH